MKKNVLVLFLIFGISMSIKAQSVGDDWAESSLLRDSYQRGPTIRGSFNSFFIRPEYYGGWAMSMGFNPYNGFQVYGGINQLRTEDLAWNMGLRGWLIDNPFSIWIDNRYSFAFDFENLAMTLAVGFSYKDFDIGAGLEYGSDPAHEYNYEYNYGYDYTDFSIRYFFSIGYNIRFYEHR